MCILSVMFFNKTAIIEHDSKDKSKGGRNDSIDSTDSGDTVLLGSASSSEVDGINPKNIAEEERHYPITATCTAVPARVLEMKGDSRSRFRILWRCCFLMCLREKDLLSSFVEDRTSADDGWDKDSTKSSSPKKAKQPKMAGRSIVNITSGYLSRPQRKFGYDSMATLRIESMAVLEKKSFAEHTKITRDGFVIRYSLQKFMPHLAQAVDESSDGSDSSSEEDEKDEQAITHVNYVLQMKLDELTRKFTNPVDGFAEALIKSVYSPNELMKNDTAQKNSRRSTMSRTSISTKMINLNQLRDESMTGGRASKSGARTGVRAMAAMSTPLFLALLPNFSEQIRDVLMGEFDHNVDYVHLLMKTFDKKTRPKQKNNHPSEKWMATVYIDHKSDKLIDAFQRLFVKYILHEYLIAFEEKDMSRWDVVKEFKNRPRAMMSHRVPFVYSDGVAIGDVGMLYTLHTQRAMNWVFKHSMMDPTMYSKWLSKSPDFDRKEALALKVPLASHPNVQRMLKGKLQVTNSNNQAMSLILEKFMIEGAFVVNRAQRVWNEEMQRNKYTEPQLLRFVQLNRTIRNVLDLMEMTLKKKNKLFRDQPETEDGEEEPTAPPPPPKQGCCKRQLGRVCGCFSKRKK